MEAPAGYMKLADGVRCRCVRLWTDGTDHYCCKGAAAPCASTYIDPSPVIEKVKRDDLRRLIELARECAEDLEAHISDQYQSRAEQPVQARRYERDMSAVRNLRHAISQIEK